MRTCNNGACSQLQLGVGQQEVATNAARVQDAARASTGGGAGGGGGGTPMPMALHGALQPDPPGGAPPAGRSGVLGEQEGADPAAGPPAVLQQLFGLEPEKLVELLAATAEEGGVWQGERAYLRPAACHGVQPAPASGCLWPTVVGRAHVP
jgi:hypothetical protein